MQDLFSRLAVARSEGTHHDLIRALKTVSLLIIDDFMTTPISTRNAVDLLEVVEARDGKAATIITSQLEPEDWYLNIDDELIADTLLNRLATGSIFLDIEGPNMREHMSGGKGREKEKKG
jgi:DNA replication protein DnaC